MEENKILVLYINVVHVPSDEISTYCREVAKKIIPDTFQGEIIILPVLSSETRVDCINPKYITDEKLVQEHTELIKKLNIALRSQLEILNENKNE
jgi:hypothetical protein